MPDPLDQLRDDLRECCQHCDVAPAKIIITAADDVGQVLDAIGLCRPCFDKAQSLSRELEIGDTGTNKELRQ